MLQREHLRFNVFLAFLLMPLSGMATDIYLPSLPSMAANLHATPEAIQFSLTIFLLGYGAGQLFVGNFMDSFGRYRFGLGALFLFGWCSVGIAFCRNVWVLDGLRCLQGLLAAVTVIAKRTFFVDMFEGVTLKRYLSSFTVVWSMGPILAPFIGGLLQTSFGWQANFYFLAAFAWSALALECWRGGETLAQPQPFNLADIVRRYRQMLTHEAFLLGLMVIALGYGAIMVFSMAAPFVIEHVYGLSPKITGLAALLMGVAWMTGGLAARFFLAKSLLWKHGLGLCALILVLLAMFVSASHANVWTFVSFAFMAHAAFGIVFNIYFAQCLGMFPQFAGLSGGLTGGIAFILTSLLSYAAVHVLSIQGQRDLALAYGVFLLGLAVCWLWQKQRHPAP